MKKIDVHAHSSMWAGLRIDNNIYFGSLEEIKKRYIELGIEKGFIMTMVSPECRMFMQSNEEIEHIVSKFPDDFYWFCNVDPRMVGNTKESDLSKILLSCKERGAKGIGEVSANLYFDDPLMENLFYHAGECDMPVTVHLAPKVGGYYGIVDDLGLPRLKKILKKYPKLKILGHSQCFWSEIGDNVNEENRGGYVKGKVNEGAVVRLLRECPNLYCDLSAGSGYNALARDEEFAYRFIEEFGDRLLFGTDICKYEQEILLPEWLDKSYEAGCISEENYFNICRGNAIKLFNL